MISDFAFSPKPTLTEPNKARVTIYGASKSGALYYQEIAYKLSSFVRDNGEEMKIDQDNSDLMMTEAVKFDSGLKIVENRTQCLSVFITS